MSSIKPEVHNISQCHQRRTEPSPLATRTENWRSSDARFLSYASRQIIFPSGAFRWYWWPLLAQGLINKMKYSTKELTWPNVGQRTVGRVEVNEIKTIFTSIRPDKIYTVFPLTPFTSRVGWLTIINSVSNTNWVMFSIQQQQTVSKEVGFNVLLNTW